MKKIIIKFIAFTLLLAMLVPLAVACDDDPPANEGGGEVEGEGEGSGSGEGGGGEVQVKNTVDAEYTVDDNN